MEIEDTKYEALVAAKADAESKVTDLTSKLAAAEQNNETLEADKVKANEERDAFKLKAEAAEETARVAAMRDERLAAFGTGFAAALAKRELTAKRVREQAATLSDEDWTARLDELEESLEVKRDAALDAAASKDKDNPEALAGLLFTKADVAKTGLVSATSSAGEVTASDEPSVERRQTVMGGLMRKPKRETAKA